MPPEAAIPDTLKPLSVPLSGLKPYSRNPRQGDVGALVQSLEHHGQYRPIVVNARTQEVLAGNHTVAAARQLGWTEIAATFVDVDEDQAARIVLVDNRSNDLASYDDSALLDLLRSLPTLDGTGFDGDALDDLIADLEPADRTSGDTDPAGVPDEPRTKPGDVYVLGEHRLICGSSTDAHTIDALMGAELADLLITDPPYGVAYESAGRRLSLESGNGGTKQHKPIANDALTHQGTRDLFRDAATIAPLKPGAAFYITVPPGDLQVQFELALIDADLPRRHGLVWVKDSLVFGRADYHYRHEIILYGWKDGAGHYFTDSRKEDTVWEIARPKRSDEHPTMKPVELFERMINNSSRPGETVIDLFGGSGTTLIACENLGRRARLVELDPGYCDVIVDRWQRHTGKQAELQGAENDDAVQVAA